MLISPLFSYSTLPDNNLINKKLGSYLAPSPPAGPSSSGKTTPNKFLVVRWDSSPTFFPEEEGPTGGEGADNKAYLLVIFQLLVQQ